MAKAAPDGYTFLLTDNSFAVSAALYEKLPYNPIKDLAPVTIVAESPAVLVARPGLTLKSLKDIVQFGQKNQNGLTFGSGGIGSSAHLAMEAFLTQNSVQLNHIPFKGIAGAITDVAADRVDLAIGSVGSAQAYIKEGRLQGVAVSGAQRHPLLPQVPTFAESGLPGFELSVWHAIYAPKGTPRAVVDKLSAALRVALKDPQLVQKYNEMSAIIATQEQATPEYLKRFLKSDVERWRLAMKAAGVQPE